MKLVKEVCEKENFFLFLRTSKQPRKCKIRKIRAYNIFANYKIVQHFSKSLERALLPCNMIFKHTETSQSSTRLLTIPYCAYFRALYHYSG